MKRIHFLGTLVCSLVLLAPTASYAQWYRRAAKTFRANSRALYQAIVSPHRTVKPALERNIATHVAQAAASTVPPRVKSAVFTLKERDGLTRWIGVTASAFAIEEIYQGKRYVWGITAAHYGFERPAVKKSFLNYQPITIVTRGNSSASDVLLFELPEYLAAKVTPLPLAEHPAELGEELYSVGIFDKEFQYEPNRIVQEVSPFRMITSLTVDPEIFREGACGGPLLNSAGEVVGVHVGSSPAQQIGYAVPLTQIRQALTALHEHGHAESPLLFQGQEIYRLNIDEGISRIQFFEQDKLVYSFSTFHHEKEIDYEHLEKFLPLAHADLMVLTIEKESLTTNALDKPTTFRLYYHLTNGNEPELERVFP